MPSKDKQADSLPKATTPLMKRLSALFQSLSGPFKNITSTNRPTISDPMPIENEASSTKVEENNSEDILSEEEVAVIERETIIKHLRAYARDKDHLEKLATTEDWDVVDAEELNESSTPDIEIGSWVVVSPEQPITTSETPRIDAESEQKLADLEKKVAVDELYRQAEIKKQIEMLKDDASSLDYDSDDDDDEEDDNNRITHY